MFLMILHFGYRDRMKLWQFIFSSYFIMHGLETTVDSQREQVDRRICQIPGVRI